MDAAKEALFLAQFHVERAAQTGFAQGACAVGGRYFLSGPLVGHADPWVPAHPERIWITPAEVPDLIWDLNGAGGGGARWAAAVIDNGASVVLANDLAATYIPCGVHLPSNATIVIGQPDDGLYWQYYGWPPAERLAAYAQKHGWLDRISTMVAQTIEDRMIDPPHKRYTSPFEWVRPMLGCDGDNIEFIELEPAPDRRIDRHGFPWGWPSRGGQHRLQIVDPDRYTQLHEHVLASPDVVRQTLTTAAELVVEGAQRALTNCSRLMGPPCGEHAKYVLNAVADTDPADIVERRLDPNPKPPREVTRELTGYSSFTAPHWAQLISYARRAGMHVYDRTRYRAARHIIDADPARIAQALENSVSNNLLLDALEAIGLWCADPLPVADIDYAGRYAASRWPC